MFNEVLLKQGATYISYNGERGKLATEGCRRVYLFPKNGIVIKLKGGLTDQNKNELKNFKKIKKKDLKYFAHVYGIYNHSEIGEYLVQEYIKDLKTFDKKRRKIFTRLETEYKLSDVIVSTPYEKNSYRYCNLAVTEKAFKIYDLGYERF